MAAKKTAKSKATAKRKTRTTTVKRKTTAKRKTVAKTKTTAKRKTVAKKATAKKVAPKKRLTAIRTPYSKTQTIAEIAESTDMTKKQISAVFDALGEVIQRHVKPGGAGQFTLPGLAKVVVQHKKATKARKGKNPFTGEDTVFKAKPARNVVKVRPLKKLKEMAAK